MLGAEGGGAARQGGGLSSSLTLEFGGCGFAFRVRVTVQLLVMGKLRFCKP